MSAASTHPPRPDRLVRAAVLLVPLLLLLGAVGCGDDDDPVAPRQPAVREPVARFSVRNGTQLDPLGSSGIFDDGQDDAMLEFPIDFGTAARVTAEFAVSDFIYSSADPFAAFEVSVYAANGVPDAGDYGAGTRAGLFALAPGGRDTFSLDVTGIVADLQASGTTHLGLRFSDSTYFQLSVRQEGSQLTAEY